MARASMRGWEANSGDRVGDDGASAEGCEELVDAAHALAAACRDDDGAGGHGRIMAASTAAGKAT